MRTRWMWAVMFVLGAGVAVGIGWLVAFGPPPAEASPPDRLGDSLAVTGNVAQGLNAFYLISRERTMWYLEAVITDPRTLKMTKAPRRSLMRDLGDVVKELRLKTPRSLNFMMSTGQYSPELDLVYVYEMNSRILVAYAFDVKKREIARVSFIHLEDK